MSPVEMLRAAANLSTDDVSIMAAALGWPSVEKMRYGYAFDIDMYNEKAKFYCEPGDRERFEPFSFWLMHEGVMEVNSVGRCVVALRLLASRSDF